MKYLVIPILVGFLGCITWPFLSSAIQSDIKSPLTQFQEGIPSKDIKCKENLQLVIKSSDRTPACVSPETKTKLIGRGWGESINDSHALVSEPKSSTRIEISFVNITKTRLLPVVFSEITTDAKNLDKVTVWNFDFISSSGDNLGMTWDMIPKDVAISYEITSDGGQDIIDHTRMPENWAIPSDEHMYNMDCGGLHIVGESAHPSLFPITKNTGTIIAKNSWMGIFPNSDGEYSFEFASLFETSVKLPEHAKIISQESKQCKLTQHVEGDENGKYTDGYYTKMAFKLE